MSDYLGHRKKNEKRNKEDFYQTPYHCTRLLLEKEKLSGSVLEPAAGKGAIVKVLKEFNYNPDFYDIETGTDFFNETKHYNNIITNPPFRLANEFILKALQLSLSKVIMLLPINYLQGKKRYDTIWCDRRFALETVYVFTRYLLMNDTIEADGKCSYGMMTFAFYVWHKGYQGEPQIKWLDNDDFIKGKK